MTEQPKTPLTVTEAAMRLGISASFLSKMRREGTGPEYIKLGRSVRYDPDALEAWLHNQSRLRSSLPLSE